MCLNLFIFLLNKGYPEMNPVTIVQSDTISLTANLTESLTASVKPSDLTYKKLFFCAKRGSGRSKFIIPMIKVIRSTSTPDHITIITPTEKANPVYRNEISDVPILHRLEEDFLDTIPSLCERSNHVLLVLDDCMGAKNKIMMSKVHQLTTIPNLTLFIVCQYPLFSCDIIKSFDICFFGKEDMRSNIERMFGYTKRISSIENFASFNKMIIDLPGFSFLCVKNVKKDNKPQPKSIHKTTDSTLNVGIAGCENKLAIQQLGTLHTIINPSMILIGQNDQINARLVKTIVSSLTSKLSDIDNKDITSNDCDSDDSVDTKDTDTTIDTDSIDSTYADKPSTASLVPMSLPQRPIDHLVVITRYNKTLYEDLTESIYESPCIIKSILKEQKNTEKSKRKHYMIVMEWARTMLNEEYVAELMFNGRHYGISYVIIFKYPVGLSPELRTNFDVIFVNAGSDLSAEKRLYDHYFGMFPCFKTFRQVYEQICEPDDSFIVVMNRGTKKSITDKIKWTCVANTLLSRYPQIPLTIEPNFISSKDSDDCSDRKQQNASDKNIIAELKTKYNDQQGLIRSISILLEQARKEAEQIKILLDKLS